MDAVTGVHGRRCGCRPRHPRAPCWLAVWITGIVLATSAIWGAEHIAPSGIKGALVLCGGGTVPAAARARFLQLAGGETARLVVIPTAAEDAELSDLDKFLVPWREAKLMSLTALHTRSSDIANGTGFTEPLQTATGVWFEGGSQSRIAEAYLGTAVERELKALLHRGGVIGGTSAGAAVMSHVMIAGGNPQAEVRTGLDFLPGGVIDQHFTERNRLLRLQGVLEKHPDLFGLGIDEGTAVILRGREISILGTGKVTISLARSVTRPPREIVFSSGEATDLIRWRRAARARTAPAFPATHPDEPKVSEGSLVIVGGGRLPSEIVTRFVELAGGPDSTIVVLPTASERAFRLADREDDFLREAGCKHVVTLTGRTLAEVSSPEFLATITSARGIWFGGGRQWRFVDAYAETPALEAFRDVLRRGGVIGGSSAGATIQGEYLVRGSPQGNSEMMAEGYEQGFQFLPGVAIDQHFTQRKRQADLEEVVTQYPQLLGIGLDEETGIVVQGSAATVLGKFQAHFYDTRRTIDGKPAATSVGAGMTFDLVKRHVVEK